MKVKFVIEQSKIRYAMYGSIQIKKLNKKHRNNLKNQCQLLSSMPIVRMPIVLAPYIYVLDRLWQPKCNHVFFDFWKLFAHIIFTESYLFQDTVEVDYNVRWVISQFFLDNRTLYNYVVNIAAFEWLRLICESKIKINLGVIKKI